MCSRLTTRDVDVERGTRDGHLVAVGGRGETIARPSPGAETILVSSVTPQLDAGARRLHLNRRAGGPRDADGQRPTLDADRDDTPGRAEGKGEVAGAGAADEPAQLR